MTEARNMLILGDHTPEDHPELNAGMKGLVPRDPIIHGVGYCASIPPANIDCYPMADIPQIVQNHDNAKSRLSDLLLSGNDGQEIPSLDQNGQGFCWNYGPVGGLTAQRAKMKLPYARLSAHAIACKQTNFQDVGGWGAKALEFLLVNGCPDTAHWAEKSMSRSYDTPATWTNAKLYMPDVTFADLASPNYNRDLSWAQTLTMLLRRCSVIADYDWWGHCVQLCDVVVGASQRAFTRGEDGKLLDMKTFDLVWGMSHAVTQGLGIRFRNSWADTYGDRGFAVLTGSKAPPSNAVAIMSAAA